MSVNTQCTMLTFKTQDRLKCSSKCSPHTLKLTDLLTSRLGKLR